jgi:hypothetical protein
MEGIQSRSLKLLVQGLVKVHPLFIHSFIHSIFLGPNPGRVKLSAPMYKFFGINAQSDRKERFILVSFYI